MLQRSSAVTVGIVTRTKNRTALLRRALESVRNQSHQNWHLVIVNDGGAPEPVDRLVAATFGDDIRVRVLHHGTSKGMEAASNAGIEMLATDYAIIHDDDDSWAPEFLRVAIQILLQRQAQFPSIRGIVTRLNAVYETVTANLVQIERLEPWRAGGVDDLQEGMLSVQKIMVRNQFPPIAFLFDLGVCRELGMFDASLPVLGDWDFHTRFLLRHDIWVHPEYLAFYHHRTSASGALGNAIHTAFDLQHAYRGMLRNKWIRSDLSNGSIGSRMPILLGMEIQDDLSRSIDRLRNDIRHEIWSARPPVPKYRSSIRQALSDGLRILKRLLKKVRDG